MIERTGIELDGIRKIQSLKPKLVWTGVKREKAGEVVFEWWWRGFVI